MKTRSAVVAVFFALGIVLVHNQGKGQEPESRKYFIGSSAFVIANIFPDPPSFYQLNVGAWLTSKDVLAVEAKTWTYRHPLGIPYGSSFGSPAEEFPGFVRGYGVGIGYQRYLWNGLYSAAEANAFLQNYVNQLNDTSQKGFQLFLALRVGYHVSLFQERFFLEPSVACTSWPVNTNVPESFKKLDNKWPKYFLFEPGLHFGFML